MDIKQEMLDLKKWAVVGVSAKKDKWGYKIWKILKDHGYETYGVNPNYEEIEGEKIYKSLADLPVKVDVIDVVVPKNLTMVSLEEAKELGIEYIFLQPGTYDDKVVDKAEELDLKYLVSDCIYATLKKMEKS